MKIANHDIGEGHPCWITSEIGINHSGSLELAKKLIDASVLAGVDAVKFQKRNVEKVYSKEELDKPRESPWGTTNREQKLGLEFGETEYHQIDLYCREKKIIWYASPWDTDSVEFLEQFDIPVYKVASACVTDLELIRRIGMTGKPVIMSTGMSTVEEISRAVSLLKIFTDQIALLACVSTYPAKTEELQLRRIETIKRLWPDCEVGYSGHEVGLYTSYAAVVMGANLLERHITLDRSMYGSDQAASIEPGGFMRLVRDIRDFQKACGNGKIEVLESEKPIREKLRRIK